MGLDHYRFISVWQLKPSPDEVYEVLQDIDSYPSWWPEVRSVDRLDEATVTIVVQSFLPYRLTFNAAQTRRDPRQRVLETAMRGDLEGFSRWTLKSRGAGTEATFEEDVVARKSLLRRLALVARPLFRLNHSAMMRHG